MSARNYYVYELLCEDGPYIGHSCREDRAAQHKYVGRKVLSFRKLQDGLTKQEALTLERQTIAEAGRVDLGTGPLTNLRIGIGEMPKHQPDWSVIRLDPVVKKALMKAAQADQRSLSAMAQIALAGWLKDKGYLK